MDYLELLDENKQRIFLWAMFSFFASLFLIAVGFFIYRIVLCNKTTLCYVQNSIGLLISLGITIILLIGFRKMDNEIIIVQQYKDNYLKQIFINKELENIKIIKSLKLSYDKLSLSLDLKKLLGIKT